MLFFFFCAVSRHARPSETITARDYTSSLAGKGVIQSIAISRAGQRAELAGAIGVDGATIPTYLTTFGIGTSQCKKPEVAPVCSVLYVLLFGIFSDIRIRAPQYTPAG